MFTITSPDYAKLVVDLIEEKINKLLENKSFVTLGIPGGKSIIPVLEELNDAKIPWKKTHIFWVDERIVSLEDENSNYYLANKYLLENLIKNKKITTKNIHPFVSIENYESEINELGGEIDIVIFGVGEDGHIASLFPNHEALESQEELIHITDSPKPPAERFTFGPELISLSKIGILLFIGKEKEGAFNQLEKANFIQCPATLIKELPESFVFRGKNV
jgi:6-phosphogluconolactonase